MTGSVDHADADDVRLGRGTGPGTVRFGPVTGDQTRDVRAVPARVAVRLLAREVDPRDDAAIAKLNEGEALKLVAVANDLHAAKRAGS